ncbi:MAG: Gldg family protein, partial [Planctomycetota bacterium]
KRHINFQTITSVMLYLNHVFISRRRWASGKSGSMALQYAVRAVCVLIVGASLLKIFWHYPVRADLSSEGLFSLSSATRDTLKELKNGNKITIQSFISPEVPADYVETRRQLLGLLKQYQLASGGAVEWKNKDVEPFSEAAEEARALGIEPMRVVDARGSRQQLVEFFLGVFIQSSGKSGDELVIPQFGKGLPIEYELTRSLRTVSQSSRLKVGVLLTDARPMSEGEGGGEWEIIRELKKQYEVIAVNPSQKILTESGSGEPVEGDSKEGPAAEGKSEAEKSENGEEKKEESSKEEKKQSFDVLLAIMPSSLNESQMANFVEWVKAGKPTLIFDDPAPVAVPPNGLAGAPRQPKPSQGGGMFGGGPPPEQKADGGELSTLMTVLGARWNYGRIVTDPNNPHAQFRHLDPEYVFVSRTGDGPSPFAAESKISRNLQDVVLLYSGTIEDKEARKEQKFIPLLRTSSQAGFLEWEDFTESSFNPFNPGASVQLKQVINRRKIKSRDSEVLAAYIRNESSETPLNVVFCADADMVTDMFFRIRSEGTLDVEFDNVTFVLNAVDALAGDETFIDLRSRRESLRTLKFVEEQTQALREQLSSVEKEGQEQLDLQLKAAEDELRAEIKKVEENQELDSRSKAVQLKQKEQQLNRKLEVQREELERQLNSKVRKAELEMNREIKRVEGKVFYAACLLPAILPVCFGMLFLGLRNLAEQQTINPNRRKN